ncbi:MAG: hypothetical protein J5504_00235 [Butyrivibrio sp.]|nr:hypothetical protein [Butyrivibrio sp.]
MIRDVKAIICLKKKNMFWNVAIAIIGIVAMIFLMLYLWDDERANLYTGLYMASFMALCMCVKVCFMAVEIPRGLSFGMTRVKLFAWNRVWDFIELVIIFLPVAFWAENGVYLSFKLMVIFFGFNMWLEGIAGNSILKLGRVAWWTYYVLFFALFMTVPKIIFSILGFEEVLNLFFDRILSNGADQLQIWIGIIAFVVTGTWINWMTFRKIEVRFVS